MTTFRNPDNIHSPLASYSHQAEVSGSARWLVLSAQVGMTKDGHIPEDVFDQTNIAFDNIVANLKAADMDIKNLVKLVFYFVGEHNIAQRRAVIKEMLEGHLPCTTVIFVAGLASPALKIEIDAWACSQ